MSDSGLLFKDLDIEISINISVLKYMVRMQLTFKSNSPLHKISQVNAKITNEKALNAMI